MDWISFTASSAADLIAAQRRNEPMEERIEAYNRDFSTSHRRWFEAIYQDKYEYMGEFDLMSLAFLLDLGFYYLGIVSQPFKMGPKALLIPPFAPDISRPIFYLMRTYNRRFSQIARRRRRLNQLGRMNCDHRCLISGFTLGRGDLKLLLKTLLGWVWLELTEGWRSWGMSAPECPPNQKTVPAPAHHPQTGRSPASPLEVITNTEEV